jgi:hypothetical protein
MSVICVLGLSDAAWTGLLTVTPAVLVAALLVWFAVTGRFRG